MNLLWIIVFINSILVDGKSLGDTPEPDITLLSRVTKGKQMNMTCVAGSNAGGSALAFITPLGGVYTNPKQVSIYTSTRGSVYPSDTYDCDFMPTCADNWRKWNDQEVVVARWGYHDLAPVTDERWENFPTYCSKGHNTVSYNFTGAMYSVGLSVRTSGEVSVEFCTEKNNTRSSNDITCYWIINDNSTKSMTVWECTSRGIQDPRELPYNCTKKSSGTGIQVSESFWMHFKLNISKTGFIKVENHNSTLLTFNILSSVSQITQILLRNTEKALWRVHDYNYLSILQRSNASDSNQWRAVGPMLQADDTGSVCVELYVATCPTCTFSFRLNQLSETKEIRGNSTQDMQHWQLLRLEIGATQRDNKMEVQVSGSAGAGYWLIGNVRRCHKQETRAISLTVPIKENDVISCQVLNQPDKWGSIHEGNITNNNNNLDVCTNVTYTGSKCGVSCLSALGTDCSGVIVCEPTSSHRGPSRCACAAGYTGAQCQDISYAPLNVKMNWVNDKVSVTWDYSSALSASSYNISTAISITLTQTILVSYPYFQKNFTILPKQNNNHYSFEVPDNITMSSTYRVQVSAVTARGALPQNTTTVNVSSPAAAPMLVGHVTCGTRTSATQNITIPAAHPDTLTTRSFIYILICNSTNTDKSSSVTNENKLHLKLHSWSKCTGTSWIAANLSATNESRIFIVGESGDQTKNKPLTPDSYMINVIFLNEYNSDEKYVVSAAATSTFNMETESNPALYALLLLLLIPAIVIFVFWRKRSSKKIPKMSASYHVVTGPNIQFTNNTTQDNSMTNENNTTLLRKKDNNLQNKIAFNNIHNSNIKEEQYLYSKVVDIDKFLNYVKESLENSELRKQFELLPKGEHKPNNIGTSKENAAKNRYKNLTAYDHSRVILEKIPGDNFSDFINANYIDGYKQNNAYIATQGPKKSTVNDFWRMIWQEKVVCIVMLTNLTEEGKVKCEKYWPDVDEPINYELISVTLLEVDTYADFEYRIFSVRRGSTTRNVQQYHFTSWPDHGVPLYPQSLVPFLDKLKDVSPADAHIVVHCSAGIGRTGTIILADICVRMAAAEGKIDVLKYYYIMREQRCNMVAEYDQYELVHMVLLEYLFAASNSIPCVELSKTVDQLIQKRKMEEQMKYLKNTAWQTQGGSGISEENAGNTNKSKNRFPDIVPNRRRIYLSQNVNANETSDYINAIPVDGYRNKGQFIVTQNPLPNTMKDFWQMVSEFHVEVIVSLNEIMKSGEFWPQENKEITVSPHLTVKFLSVLNETIYYRYNLHLINSRNSDDDAVKSITIFQFKNWKYKEMTPSDEQQIIDFVTVTIRHISPTVVTCYDGARASGLYVALSFVLEKIKLEQVCDVCLAVRTVRNNREQFVNDIKQFEFLYKAAVKYVSLFELYSNFEK